jgi:hypothetical protein
MPSTTPPIFPHYTTPIAPSHYAPTTARVGIIPSHSWGRSPSHQHQPAAIYDTTPDLYSHDSFSYQDYAPTDHIILPPSSTFSSPAQPAIPPTTRYPSPMSRHPPWAYPGYTQWQSANSVDAHASSSAPSIVHNVWLLECRHCRTFLTNRGMKVRVDR